MTKLPLVSSPLKGGIPLLRLLIVDDESLVRQGIVSRVEILAAFPADLRDTGDSREALEIIRAWRPQIVIADIHMPYLDGLALIRAVREWDTETQFILLSGYAEFAYAEQALHLGVSNYLLKPVTNDALIKALTTAAAHVSAQEQLAFRLSEHARMKADLLAMDRQQHFLQLLAIAEDTEEETLRMLHLPLFQRAYDAYMLALIDARALRTEPLRLAERITACASASDLAPMPLFFPQALRCNQVYGVFCLQGDQEAAVTAACNQLLLIARAAGLELTIGLSTPLPYLSQRAQKQALIALRKRLVYGQGKCFPCGGAGNSHAAARLERALDALQNAIQRRDIRAIEGELCALFAPEQLPDVPPHYVWTAWLGILKLLIRQSNTEDALPAGNLWPDSLDRFDDKAEFLAYLHELILTAINPPRLDDMKADARVLLAIDYVRAHFREELNLNDLSCQYALSPNYFSTVFKRETGMGMVGYITTLRIREACRLLRDSTLSVSEIAGRVGYSDSQYFFRIFKKSVGLTPIQYRKEPIHEDAL